MNVTGRRHVKSSAWRPPPRLAACALAALALAGCRSGFVNPMASYPVDPNSPVADEVAKAADADAKFPSFLDIPDLPTDVRTAEAWGKSVSETTAAGEQLARDTAPSTWSLTGTEGFASGAQRATADDAAPRTSEDAEAYARRLRERATPPPLTR